MSSSTTSAASGGDSKYFQTTKKGEIKELQDDLNSLDKFKVKEAVKKVIAAMTVGKDVSTLFSDVIKSMATDNIELKKLVYLYIINYARSQPEKAILVVNMFQRDATSHPNPLVRALAIRTMGCIRVDRITEYLCDPLMVALKDKDPYVRKTAAICVAKLYDIQADLVMERGFIEQLRAMLSDTIPMVVANAVAALTEISVASGSDQFKIDGSTISKLLTAINDCGDWSRVFILEAVSRFDVTNPALARDVCDRVVPQLQHANSAVVMAAVKVIIHCLPKLKKDAQTLMCSKLTPPLVTLVSSTQPEIQYVALRNIDLIVQRYPRILEKEIRAFFVKFNDAVYVKMEKLEILIKLASKRTFEQVLSEFQEYASEIDIEFVRKSVRAIGRVAIKLSEAAEKCVKVLSDLVKTKVNYVVQEAVIVIRDIFRKYPRKYEKIIVTLCQNLEALDEPEAKASMIWIIGEYAERITDAGERLEYFIDSFEEESPTVQLQLVTATVKLFLKKPESAKTLVTRVLELATEKSDNPDLRDRGYVYWRLLSTDPKAAKEVVLAPRPVISSETYSPSEDYLDTLLENISTLSAVYHRAPTEFVRGMRGGVKLTLREEDEDDDEDDSSSDDSSSEDSSDEDSSDQDSSEEKEDPSAAKKRRKKAAAAAAKSKGAVTSGGGASKAAVSSVPVVSVSAPADSGGGDLLSDLFGGGGGGSSSATATTSGGGGGFMDDFDPFGDSGPAVSSTPALPPMTPVMQAATHKGLNVDFGYIRKSGVPTLVVRVQNAGSAAVVRMDVKFNTNYLGIAPKAQLPLTGSVMPGNTQVVEVPMALSGPESAKSPFDTLVMVGIRVGYGDGNKDVFKFQTSVPTTVFFEEGASMDQTAYLAEWKAIPGTAGKQAMLKVIKSTDEQAVQGLIAAANGRFVAPRKIPGKGVALYFLFALKGTLVLSEVSIANSGACRIVSKSRNELYAQIVTFGVQTLLAA